MSGKAGLPPFDDSRKALAFALNAAEVDMPRPAMTRAMAGAHKPKETKAAARRRKKLEAELGVSLRPEPGERRSDYAADARREARERWLSLEQPAQAGLILREFGKLDREHRAVLSGLLVRSHVPCSCKRPCCSGWSQQARWTAAVAETCQLLKESVDLVRQPGKKGLGTQPVLRRAVVEAWFTKREATLAELGAMGDVSPITAAKHKAWIVEGLERIETEAWLQVDAMFDAAGITGTIVE